MVGAGTERTQKNQSATKKVQSVFAKQENVAMQERGRKVAVKCLFVAKSMIFDPNCCCNFWFLLVIWVRSGPPAGAHSLDLGAFWAASLALFEPSTGI